MIKLKKNDSLHIQYIIKWASIIMATIILLALLAYSFILYGGKLVVDQAALILPMTSTVETEDGELIAEFYDENRRPVEIDDLPDHVGQAFVAIEDRRFYQHAGIDFKSILRAVYRDIIAFSKVEGASTITQQLAKNLFLSKDKSWMRKTKEAMAAIYLERTYSKDEILELYINTIYYGHGAYGIELAAERYFSKSAKDLTLAEAALLAGVINSPSAYSPIDHPEKALSRRNLVLKNMADAHFISLEESMAESGKTLGLKERQRIGSEVNDSYVDLVLKEVARDYQISFAELQRGGYRIIVSLEEEIQDQAYDLFLKEDYFPGNRPGVEGAFVVLDRESGQVLAALGGRDYHLGDLNRVTSKRQPGSIFKPLAVYGPAFMEGTYHPYSLIKDEPLEYDGYVAKNYDDQYAGETTIYQALIQSKNAPAVWLLNEIGINQSKTYLDKMGLPLEDDNLSLALGGLKYGVTPLDMASSYQMIANGGSHMTPRTIVEVYNRRGEQLKSAAPKEERVFSTQVAWDLTKMLEATVQQGTAQVGSYPKALAGKTGSTEHPRAPGYYKDAWFVGFTPELVTALWMGYDLSDEAHYLTEGSRAPTILTKDILKAIDQKRDLGAAFEKPEEVEDLPDPIELPLIEEVQVQYKYGLWPLVQGEITWSASADDRVIYHIYEQTNQGPLKIGEVTGENSFLLENVSLFSKQEYFIVPFDPLTNRTGEPSEEVSLSW